jgi:transposase
LILSWTHEHNTAVRPTRKHRKTKPRQPARLHGYELPRFDKEAYKRRNVIERCFEAFKQWRGIATRYDKLAVTYRGGVILRVITIWLKPLVDTP